MLFRSKPAEAPVVKQRGVDVPNGKLLDQKYKLVRAEETYYDPDTREVYLSPAEVNQLVRSRGFYFLLTFDEAKLIPPPELRAAAAQHVNKLSPLIPIGRSTFQEFHLTPDPEAYVKEFAHSVFNVTPTSITTSTKKDRDYAIPKDITGENRTAREKARKRAFWTEQATTREEAKAAGKDLPMRDLKPMDPETLMETMSVEERTNWYLDKLGAFQAQLYESAMARNIPMQLLAAVILNELGDIDWKDLVQSGKPRTRVRVAGNRPDPGFDRGEAQARGREQRGSDRSVRSIVRRFSICR